MSRVIKSFRCKDTGVAYYAGQDYNGGRTEELAELGYVEEINKDLTVKEIKVKLDKLGIEYEGNAKKAELLKLLGE